MILKAKTNTCTRPKTTQTTGGKHSGSKGLADAVWRPIPAAAPLQRRGSLLLREVDGTHRICGALAGCFRDHRNQDFVEHDLAAMLR